MWPYIIIAFIVILVISVVCLLKHSENLDMQEKLSARDYWRWKNGGID